MAVSGLLFTASAAITIACCTSMDSMRGMPMPGGWTMSMMWMRMPGQSWPGAAASFLGMWIVMMVAMMLPSLVPMLRLYRHGVGRVVHRDRLTAIAGAGYFFLWAMVGLVVYVFGAGLAELAMRRPALSRGVPIAVGIVVLIAGAIQFTAWKARHLACCRESGSAPVLPANAATAWRHGLRLGLQCGRSCANLMAILLVAGVMDMRVMAAIMAAITGERLAPTPTRAARTAGALAVAAGMVLIARAGGLG